MADPLSITASVLAIGIAAIKSTKSLHGTVNRYRGRDKTLRRLQEELEDLLNILQTLEAASDLQSPMLSLLKGPISRCSQLCRDFETSMEKFDGKSKTTFRDWTKMEFMRGDINEFMDALAGYKSTISVGLGTITMHSSKISQQVLEEYSEIIKDTTYSLNVYLERIDGKLAILTTGDAEAVDTSIDLEDERAVTKQCLRICEDARSYLESLTERESALQPQTIPDPATDTRSQFESQTLTRNALDDHRESFAEIIGRLRERLDTLGPDGGHGSNDERARLQKEIETSRQCLEVCRKASNEVSKQKIYQVGEAIADGDSDQVLVTTLADLFDVKKALATGNSAQLLGFMTDETLRKLSEDRYSSRFGTTTGGETDASLFSAPHDVQKSSTDRRHRVGREPQNIPNTFLEDYSQKERNGGPTSNLQLTRSIGVLKAYSRVTGDTSGSLKMHRLVNLAMRKRHIEEGNLTEFEREAAALLDPGGEEESSMDSQTDIQSILSVGSTASTKFSAHSSQIAQAAISLSIRLLLEDPELMVLYSTAITKVGVNKFQRNFARMLKNFGDRLREKAITEPQRQAALFLRNSRQEITVGIREEIAPNSGVLRAQAPSDLDARERLLNKWLESQDMKPEDLGQSGRDIGRESQALGDIGQLGGHDGLDESDSDEEESQLVSLEDVRLFLASSDALFSLRSDFRSWLHVNTDGHTPVLGSENGLHTHDAGVSDTQTENLDIRNPNLGAKDQSSAQAGKRLDVDYYIKKRSQAAMLRDNYMIFLEHVLGCRVSWWPLAQPEEELNPLNTRVYSRFPCGWKFYNDIPTSTAKVWFPKLDGDKHLSLSPDGKSSRNAVFLQNTTLLQCLLSKSGLRHRACGSENIPMERPQAGKLVRHGSSRISRVTPQLENPQASLDPSRRSNADADERSVTLPSEDPAEPTIFLTVNINPNEKAAYARSVDQGVNDIETLKGLRSAYYKLRTGWWQRPTGVKFYRFHSFLFNHKLSLHRISLHRDKERYPEEVDCDYIYNPRPWPSDFPFPKDEVWHYFAHPQECGTTAQINDKLPVRKSNVTWSQVQAFGIHIEEGLNNFAITLVGIFILAMTFGSTLWFVPYWLKDHQGDLQNATVPVIVASSMVLAVSQILVTLLLFKYTVAA